MSTLPSDWFSRYTSCIASRDKADALKLHGLIKAAVLSGSAKGFEDELSELAEIAGLSKSAPVAPRSLGTFNKRNDDYQLPIGLAIRAKAVVKAAEAAETPRERAEAKSAVIAVQNEVTGFHEACNAMAAMRKCQSVGKSAAAFYGLSR